MRRLPIPPAAATAAALFLLAPAVFAAPPSIHRRAVDRLTVETPDGGEVELLGVLADRVGDAKPKVDGVVPFAVRRDELAGAEAAHPGLTASLEAAPAEPEESVKAANADEPAADPVELAQALRDRLIPWMERRADAPNLSALLEDEFERVSDVLADAAENRPTGDADGVNEVNRVKPGQTDGGAARPEPSGARRPAGPWVVLNVPRAKVEGMFATAPHRRRLALLAWANGVDDVEVTGVRVLRRELEDRGVSPRDPVDAPWAVAADPEPADRPFEARPQSDAEWAARVALVESALLDDLSFQGTGSTLIRTPKAGQGVDARAMLMQMAGGQYADLIGELSQPNAFSRRTERRRRGNRNNAATEAADAAGRTGVRVTRVTPDMTTGKVAVETEFLVKLPGAGWVVGYRDEEVRNAADADPEVEKRIREDPQLQGLLNGGGALGGLGGLLGGGLGGPGGGDVMGLAVRTGAATKAAMDAVNERFEDWRRPYLDRLDGPPLPVPGDAGARRSSADR